MDRNQNNSWSKAGLTCGIVSMLILPAIFGILAVVLGILAISKGEDAEQKNTSAIIGITLGILSVLYSFYTTGMIG